MWDKYSLFTDGLYSQLAIEHHEHYSCDSNHNFAQR